MEVTSIEFLGNDGWQSYTEFNHTPSSHLHIPRIGEMIENSYGKYYIVENVIWKLKNNSVVIECKLIA